MFRLRDPLLQRIEDHGIGVGLGWVEAEVEVEAVGAVGVEVGFPPVFPFPYRSPSPSQPSSLLEHNYQSYCLYLVELVLLKLKSLLEQFTKAVLVTQIHKLY